MGFCDWCGKPTEKRVNGLFYALCKECRIKNLERVKATQKKRIEMELCIYCGKEKALENRKRCQKCSERNIKSCAEKRLRQKIWLMTKLGSKCVCCGYNKNYACLEFHEINAKEFRRESLNANNSVYVEKLLALNDDELKEKIQLLCNRCHREHHHPNCILN